MENIKKINDRFWTVKEIRPHIIRYLKGIFPEGIIMREFDKIDLMILGPNIPVEIQKTYIHYSNGSVLQELWDYWRHHTVDHKTFIRVVRRIS